MILNLLFLLLFFVNSAFAQTAQNTQSPYGIEGYEKVGVEDYFAGMNSKDYADKLPGNQASYIANAIINKKGQIATRLGQALFNTDTNSSAFTGLGLFNPDASTSYIMAVSGVAVVQSLTTGSTWNILNSGHNLTASLNAEFLQANSLYFVFNGTNPTSWVSGSSVYNVGGTWPGSVSPPTATTGTWLNNYLFLAGNSTNPDWVYVSDNLTPQSFQANQVIKINSGDGQIIKRLANYRTGDIIIYKQRSIYDLNITGVNSSCSPQPICQWQVTSLTTDVGTPAPRSVVSIGNDQWFLSSPPYGIRSLSRSQFDKTFVNLLSQPIQDIFDGTGERVINTVQISKAAGVYYDNKYLIAIPTGSSTVNDLVCVYDFITQGWYLIDGWYPAAWIVDNNNNLYYIDANDGRVIKCFSGTTGDFGTVIPAQVSGPSVAIDFKYISRIYDFDNPDNFKQLDNIGLEFFPTGDYSATISINLDNSGWQIAGTINLSGTGVTLPVNLPFTLIASGLTYKTLQLTQYGEFKKIQVMVELNGTSQQAILQKIKVFARLKPYRRT